MSPSKRALNRPKKRTLVRWDDNLNELLLLTVQSVCNNQSIRIPWSEVASTMKNNVTEGAIVQHLAKLRSRRVDAGKEVPPPLRRGGVGSSSKPSDNAPARAASGVKRCLSAPHSSGSEDEGQEMNFQDDTSSDEDYIDKSRRRSRPKKQSHRPQLHEAIPIKSDDEIDGNNDGLGELLVPGADFLQYPNEQESPSETSSPGASENTRSKLVTLRYRQPVSNASNGFPTAYAHPVSTTVNTYGNTPYQAQYQQLLEPSLDMENYYMLGYNHIMGMSVGVPEDAVTNLTSLGEHQDFHNATYAGYHHPAYYHSTDDSIGGALYSENYQYLHGNYVESNEDVAMETQGNLVMKIE
ncbi:hypothetical protein ANOM_002263 [Aspergillus nomiae NRRL 13137]|uniref:Myb-like domain-containing protein n=1 Tax=Aspergillus nomiae NRRL (strain ATCC 15546 / NRRL 13137 / CBS 260.88 / M93) TaxID=1509407 RepID=A0A0L1JCR4_ASPN3|nr:uncharacterized protein ANOM_002263 [Aspergillus nomiae NRRL 13137]KNG89502.1 hypothetical protein ANOM_002263 [Aspergillus nomiae NRRL 13137]